MDSFSYNLKELVPQGAQTLLMEQEKTENSLKMMNIFSDLCIRILNDIIKNVVIDERILLDFSKLILWIVKEDNEQPPDSFIELSEYLYDYWRYNLDEEENNQRKYSYIRLFQMANMLKIHYKECELRNRAALALEAFDAYDDIIGTIKHSPGITHKKMWKLLNISSDELRDKLRPLKQEGFVSSRRSGEEGYYMLTNAGEILYQNLKLKNRNNDWFVGWGKERVIVFCLIILSHQEEKISSMQLLNLLKKITQYKDDKIDNLFMQYQNVLYYLNHEKNSIQNNIDYVPEPYITHYWRRNRLYIKKNEAKVHNKKDIFYLEKNASADSRYKIEKM